jgi:hypothetical protein
MLYVAAERREEELKEKLSPVGFLSHGIHMRSMTDRSRRIDRVTSPSGHPWQCNGPVQTSASSSVPGESESGIAPSSMTGYSNLLFFASEAGWGAWVDQSN